VIAIAVARYLMSLNLVTYDETVAAACDCFIDDMPPEPDEAVMLKVTGGDNEFKHARDIPRLQVLVRGTKDPRVAEARATDIYSALHALRHVTLDPDDTATHLIGCKALAPPASIGTDGNGRHEYSVNFDLRVLVTSTNRI
jgi:hypothetical protein